MYMHRRAMRWGLVWASSGACAAGCAELVGLDDYGPASSVADASTPDGVAVDGAGADASADDGATRDAPGAMGCDADTDADPTHCGSCDHSCAGRACAQGLCAADTLASNEGPIWELATDGVDVVWRSSPTTNDEIRRLHLGAGAPATFAGGTLRGVAMSQGNVLWIDWGSGELRSCASAVCDGGAVLQGGLQLPEALAVDSTRIVFSTTSDQRVHTCRAPDCANGGVLAPTVNALRLAVFGTRVAWGNGAAAQGCDVASCVPVSYGCTAGCDVAVDATDAYWVDTNGALGRCAVSGCASPAILRTGRAGSQRIAADATHVYVANESDHLLFKCDKPACATYTVLARTGAAAPRAIAVDAAYLYWAEGVGASWTVKRTPK